MGTYDLTVGTKTGKGGPGLYSKPLRTVYRLVDLTAAVTAKGSALASGDIIKAIRLPTGTMIMHAGAKVTVAPTDANGNAIATFSAGLGTNSDTTKFVAQTTDITVATFLSSANASSASTYAVNTSGTDSINLIIGTYTGTALGAGIVTVFAQVADLSEFPGENISKTTQAGVPQA